jgi:hypothetical protein
MSNCQGHVDGTLCATCGECCSALCAPGLVGIDICQPANGCHVEGDLCRNDLDCCGGNPDSGLPGAGNVHCNIVAPNPVGICTGPNGCRPEGDTCAYKNYACGNSTKADDCCDALGRMSGGCQLDPQGVPRCTAIGTNFGECQQMGQTCADNLDCCGGLPCVPAGPGGTLVCGAPDAGTCVPSAGPCTVNADCCSGLACITPPGGSMGECGLLLPPPSPDGGPGVTDAGTLNCSLYGQSCAQTSDCCNGVPCSSPNGAPCGGATGCVCVSILR